MYQSLPIVQEQQQQQLLRDYQKNSFLSQQQFHRQRQPTQQEQERERSFQMDNTSFVDSAQKIKTLQIYAHNKQVLAEQLRQDLKKVTTENSMLSDKVEVLKKDSELLQSLKRELDERKKVEEKLRNEILNLKAELERKTNELDEIHGVQDELLLATATHKKQLEEYIEKNKNKDAEVQRSMKERDRLEIVVTSLENERKNYEKRLSEQKKELIDLMEQKDKENKEIKEELSKSLEHYKERTQILEKQLGTTQNELLHLKEASSIVKTLESRITELTNQCNNLRSECDILNKQKLESLTTIGSLDGIITEQKEYISCLENKVEEMKKEIDSKTKQIASMKTQINQLSEGKMQEKSQAELHIQSLIQMMNKLKMELAEQDKVIISLKNEGHAPDRANTDDIERLRQEINSSKEIINTLKEANAKLEDRLDKDHRIISALESKLNKVKEERNLLAELVTNLKNKNSN
jgi:chromosome segregation ATPase